MENFDIYQRITDIIVSRLQSGVIPWQQPWKSSESLPQNLITRRPYHGINFWLLLSLNHELPYYLTFQQVKYLGGSIKKGEKSVPVVFWKILETEETPGEEWVKRPLLRYYNVFNVSQTEGINPNCIPVPGEHDHPFDPISKAEEVIQLWADCPKIELNKKYAYYSPLEDTIGLPNPGSFFHDEQYYSTLYHEAVHATGHTNRLGRHEKMKNLQFGSYDYSQEELVAEMGAAYLCGITGIEHHTIQNSAAYIQNWIRKFRDDNKVLVIAATQAQKAVDYILNHRPASLSPEERIEIQEPAEC